ncbi:hypothetical protein ACJX0J_036236, partial [Zea mays]
MDNKSLMGGVTLGAVAVEASKQPARCLDVEMGHISERITMIEGLIDAKNRKQDWKENQSDCQKGKLLYITPSFLPLYL